MTFSYHWTYKNEHIATKYVIIQGIGLSPVNIEVTMAKDTRYTSVQAYPESSMRQRVNRDQPIHYEAMRKQYANQQKSSIKNI
jgi:hypothetical protein